VLGSSLPPGSSAAARHRLDALDEFTGLLAFGDLLANELGLGRLQGVIEIGKQGSQGQAEGLHGVSPGLVLYRLT
jgi:hypothetical protein